ncbi:hypothetical protein T484DRAFT_1932023 [Baffinella frigidus]|nr:hypothetical protein T484DRAFT_1932023 [Cryptophyta sp. CCMP2293]
MCWRDFLTADGLVLPPSTSTAVRGGAALISEEERVLLDLLAPPETHFQAKPRSPSNAKEQGNSDAFSIATTPSQSPRPSATQEL